MPIDVDKTGRILFNLLSNAIKFTGEKGRIIVQIEDRLEDGIAFSVEDTGRGIPEDRLHSIFDRSKQAGPSLAGKSDGPGMGLALVKSFVEILRGSVAAVSKVGEGSRFTVELPIVKRPAGPKINVYGLNLDAKARIELSDLN